MWGNEEGNLRGRWDLGGERGLVRIEKAKRARRLTQERGRFVGGEFQWRGDDEKKECALGRQRVDGEGSCSESMRLVKERRKIIKCIRVREVTFRR